MTTRQFSYALKSKLPGGLCLIIIGTEGMYDCFNRDDLDTLRREIFDLILRVASGERTKSEQYDFGSAEFAPWQIGATV